MCTNSCWEKNTIHTTCKVDAWDEAVINRDGIIHIDDKYIGEEAIKSTIKNIWVT